MHRGGRAALATALALVAVLACVRVVAGEGVRAFFPSRPANVVPYVSTGVLDGFDIGNGSGGLDLRTGGRVRGFYTAAHVRLDGREVACDHPPRAGRRRSMFCTDWPRGVVLGRTRVRIAYWRTHRPGFAGLVDVADGIATL